MERNKFPLIEVRETQSGKGVFAAENIPVDVVLFKIEGKCLSFDDTIALDENESYCLQVGHDEYIALHYPIFLSNHSCNPNCGINADLEFITLREIAKDEELRWDYSTSMLERHWTMKCKCGEKNCRGTVKDFDTLPQETQQKYIALGIVQPYIIEWMKQNKTSP